MAGNQKRGSKRRGSKAKKMVSGAKRAGLIFAPARCNRKLRQGRYAQRCGMGSGIFMAGVLEYLTTEILDLAGQCADEHKKKTIAPRHLCLAIRNDDELNKLAADTQISQGGVLPNVQKDLWPKNKMD